MQLVPKQDLMFPSSLFPHLEEDPEFVCGKKKSHQSLEKSDSFCFIFKEVYHFLIFFLSTRRSGLDPHWPLGNIFIPFVAMPNLGKLRQWYRQECLRMGSGKDGWVKQPPSSSFLHTFLPTLTCQYIRVNYLSLFVSIEMKSQALPEWLHWVGQWFID